MANASQRCASCWPGSPSDTPELQCTRLLSLTVGHRSSTAHLPCPSPSDTSVLQRLSPALQSHDDHEQFRRRDPVMLSARFCSSHKARTACTAFRTQAPVSRRNAGPPTSTTECPPTHLSQDPQRVVPRQRRRAALRPPGVLHSHDAAQVRARCGARHARPQAQQQDTRQGPRSRNSRAPHSHRRQDGRVIPACCQPAHLRKAGREARAAHPAAARWPAAPRRSG